MTSKLVSFTTGHSLSKSPTIGIGGFFLLCAIPAFFFEGAIRKWVLAAGDPLSYPCTMSKEIFVLAGLVLSQTTGRSASLDSFKKYLFGFPLLFAAIGCLIAATSGISLVGSLMTIRAFFLMPIGATLVGNAFNRALIVPAMRLIALGVAINAPLGIIQFYSDPGDRINCYVGGDSTQIATAGYSSNVRATGTFSYINGMGVGGITGVAAGIAMLSMSRKRSEKWLGVLTTAGGVVMALATVSRGPVFICAGLILYAIYVAFRASSPILLVVLGLCSTLFFVADAGLELPEVLVSVVKRAQTADSTLDRIVLPILELSSQVVETPLGTGLGVGQTAARRFGQTAVVETEFSRIVFEVGVLGLVGYVAIYFGALIHLYRLQKRVLVRSTRPIVVGALLTCCVLLYGGIVFNHISSMIFWAVFVSGCLLSDHKGEGVSRSATAHVRYPRASSLRSQTVYDR